jgi:AcrR family transcriptional regulator
MDINVKEPFNRDRQFALKRQAVIRAAGLDFCKRGYHNTSMTDIASNLGLTKAALYYYVKNKDEVLFECHEQAYDAMDILLEKKLVGKNGLEQLGVLYCDFVRMLTASGISLLTDVNSLSEGNKIKVLKRRGKIERKIIKIVKQGQSDGSIREGDPRLHVFFFMGALNWLNAWYDNSGHFKGEDIALHFATQMRLGIAAA